MLYYIIVDTKRVVAIVVYTNDIDLIRTSLQGF